MKSFIEFSMTYYRDKVAAYENDTSPDLYEAKQLLKMVDDVIDEGYMGLYHELETERLYTRLKTLIEKHGEAPFGKPSAAAVQCDYDERPLELVSVLDQLRTEAAAGTEKTSNPFAADLLRFCEWIGYDEDTAYVFLLRDTLLPYIYYRSRSRQRIYPWLIGRRFMKLLTGQDGLDDELRLPVFNAAEAGIQGYDAFVDYCKQPVQKTMSDHLDVEKAVRELLCSIPQQKIVVVESGCYGTFPMMLACMDERVSIRMFTTVPFLRNLYQEHLYTNAYEKNRDFETLCAQDALLNFSGFHDGRFYVTMNKVTDVREEAMREIRLFL